MIGLKLLSNSNRLQAEFNRCCKEFTHLEMYVAWVGNPKNLIPFHSLDNLDSVTIYVGTAFDQTSPEGIEYLINHKYKVVIVNTKETYHTKLYFFSSKTNSALIMGSSNFTSSGFSTNIEGNILLEGEEYKTIIQNYLQEIRATVKTFDTFIPTPEWLTEYKKRYLKRQESLKNSRVIDEAIREDNLASSSSWLGNADWTIYMKHFKKGILDSEDRFNGGLEKRLELLIEYSQNLSIPWHPSLLDKIENRRRILGSSDYGWLGHVGASGKFRKLLATGTREEIRTICNSINKIAKLEMPIDYNLLKRELKKLTDLGPTIKVWGRLLAITRPDIYCTISSDYVRESLKVLLDKPKTYFESIEGYIDLLKLIHRSPWYNSVSPKLKVEKEIWLRRVAFLDVVLY